MVIKASHKTETASPNPSTTLERLLY